MIKRLGVMLLISLLFLSGCEEYRGDTEQGYRGTEILPMHDVNAEPNETMAQEGTDETNSEIEVLPTTGVISNEGVASSTEDEVDETTQATTPEKVESKPVESEPTVTENTEANCDEMCGTESTIATELEEQEEWTENSWPVEEETDGNMTDKG